jgi:hypothetical protein
MRAWKETTLGEIADIIMGQSPTGETCNNNQYLRQTTRLEGL